MCGHTNADTCRHITLSLGCLGAHSALGSFPVPAGVVVVGGVIVIGGGLTVVLSRGAVVMQGLGLQGGGHRVIGPWSSVWKSRTED